MTSTATATMSNTALSTMATSTSSMAMGMDGMGGMDMGMDMDMGGCQLSMLWNWNTIGSCFISEQWMITSPGAFAGSCFGAIFMVVLLELLRRVQREYEGRLNREELRTRVVSMDGDEPAVLAPPVARNEKRMGAVVDIAALRRRNASTSGLLKRQIIRSTLHMLQFAMAYFIMLLAMYYNGYIIFSIFIGAWLGYFLFTWDTLLRDGGLAGEVSGDVTGCCG